MVLRRRFEIPVPLPPNLLIRVLSNVKSYLEWFSSALSSVNVNDDRTANAVLKIPGLPGRYRVVVEVTDWIEEGKHYFRVGFTGELRLGITMSVEGSRTTSRVTGEVEVDVGILWRGVMRAFTTKLIEWLSVGLSRYAREARSQTTVEGRLAIEEDPRSLEDIVYLASILRRSKHVSTLKVKGLEDLISKIKKVVDTYGGNIYLTLRGNAVVSILIEDNVITGLKLRLRNHELHGNEALKRLSSMRDIEGELQVFKVVSEE